jgi:SAM-dependent methyltransferase/uncharacterized protein YbaR (Trm112 family)
VRPEVFEELAPVCPRCLQGGGEAPLVVGDATETRAGRLWHGILHCSNSGCWMEFPVIDGVPVIVADPPTFLQGAQAQVLARDDLPEVLFGLLGDALGAGGAFDATRQHLSLYCQAHFADWTGGSTTPDLVRTLRAGVEMLGPVRGPAIDLGGAVGRGGWELAREVAPVLVADLNFAFLRLAQRLMLEGEAHFDRRRVGLVYDRVRIALPADATGGRLDFWAADAMALPFRAGAFGLATAINLVDSIAGPTEAVAEAARVLAPGGGAVFCTPHDWTASAAEPARWMGGHSQRGRTAGAAEPALTATLRRQGFEPVAERHDLPWTLRLHDRAEMHYALHLVGCRKALAG